MGDSCLSMILLTMSLKISYLLPETTCRLGRFWAKSFTYSLLTVPLTLVGWNGHSSVPKNKFKLLLSEHKLARTEKSKPAVLVILGT